MSRRPWLSRGSREQFGDLEVLKGISLAAHDGDVIAIIGASGSGKSTLLRCINLLETPDSGGPVNGELIRMRPTRHGHAVPEDHAQVDRIRSKLGMVFQSFNLWAHMTVLRERHRGADPCAEAAAQPRRSRAPRRCSHKVGIADKRDALSGPSFRRPAAARGDRPGARHGAEGHAVRRADLGARPRAGRRGAEGHAPPRRRRPHHAAWSPTR